jgi:hypothetical protein
MTMNPNIYTLKPYKPDSSFTKTWPQEANANIEDATGTTVSSAQAHKLWRWGLTIFIA